jgi:DNA polymerase-3 subunit epsilon
MRIVFFDLETGGTDSSAHPIIQIAAIAVDENLLELEVFERKVKFSVSECDPKALSVNGYNEEVWSKEATCAKAVIRDFSKFLSRYADIERRSERTGNPYRVAQLAGYNAAAFDGPFIQAWYRKNSEFLPASFRIMDVYQRAIWHFHEIGKTADSLKLSEVAKMLGVPLENAHDALEDVRATLGVYRSILNGVSS